MTETEEKIARFGYDPSLKQICLGDTEIFHNGKMSRFEFYFEPESGAIDVCYRGCNGTYKTGDLLPSGDKTTLSDEFDRGFFKVKEQFDRMER